LNIKPRSVKVVKGAKTGQVIVLNSQETKYFSAYACNRIKTTGKRVK